MAQISYLDAEAGSSSEDGYRASGGIRWQLLKFLEINGFFHYTDLDGSDEAFELSAVGYIGRVGIGASYETNEVDFTKVWVRWTFGK